MLEVFATFLVDWIGGASARILLLYFASRCAVNV